MIKRSRANRTEKLDGEIEDLMDSAAGGKLDFEKAFEEE